MYFTTSINNTSVFHNIYRPDVLSTVATWRHPLIGWGPISPPSSDDCRAAWLVLPSRTCSGGVSISLFFGWMRSAIKRFQLASPPGKQKSDSVTRSNSFNSLSACFSGLGRPQIYHVSARTRRTSDLNFVSAVYDNSCIRTALIFGLFWFLPL